MSASSRSSRPFESTRTFGEAPRLGARRLTSFCRTVHSKNSQHSEARDATVVKYSFVNDGPSHSATPSGQNSGANTPARIESSASLSSMATAVPSTPAFPVHGSGTPLASGSGAGGSEYPGFAQRLPRDPLAGEGEPEVNPEDLEVDTEVDVVIDVPVPSWTTPSHSVHPCFVSHKIKWSAFIK